MSKPLICCYPLQLNHNSDQDRLRTSLFGQKISKALIDYQSLDIWDLEFNPPGNRFNLPELRPHTYYITYHTTHNRPDVINWKSSHSGTHFYFDDNGYSTWSSVKNDENWKLIIPPNGWFQDTFNRLAYTSKYEQPKTINDISHGHILVLLQKPKDKVLKFKRFKWEEALPALINQIPSHINILIKRHPYCKSKKIGALLDRLNYPNVRVLDLDLRQALPKCMAVITINSGAGFEALIHRKKVLLLGSTDYESVCHKIYDLDTLWHAITTPVNQDLILKFLYYYLEQKTIRIDDDHCISRIQHAIINKIRTGLVSLK